MKNYKNILAGSLVAIFALGCDNDGYIDPISSVAPGPDQTAPTVVISNPNLSKIIIPFTETSTDLNIQFTVQDDIEITSVVVKLDGSSFATFDSFLDYRRTVKTLMKEDLPVGNHTVEVTASDASGKSTTQSFAFEISNVYEPLFPGEIFYMPFEAGSYVDLVSKTNATVVGTPGFAEGRKGQAYLGDEGEYLTFPTTGLTNNEFSASFWYNVNASPDRSGILTMGPPDPNLPATPNNRKYGFRFFREGSATNQTFKLNVGNGTADSWFDGGAAASLNPNNVDWVHIAFTISDTEAAVYINGQLVKKDPFTGVDWTGCDVLSIASGAPRFTEWGHLSDKSTIDELRIFNKALTQAEIQAIIDADED
jgi:hypothetical protein